MTSPAPALTGYGWLRLGETAGQPMSLAEHDAVHGPLPLASSAEIIAEVAAAGLTGRGGAAFPVHRKLAAVAAGPAPRVVIANGAEGEPASNKDKTLLRVNCHLTLDGLQLAARAVAATTAYLYVHSDPRLLRTLHHAISERRHAGRDAIPVELVAAPPRFVAGEESAVVSRIDGGDAKPRSKPPRMFESGVGGRPTLVNNVETLAHLALIVSRGATAFNTVGDQDQPGTMLFTVSGAVHGPGVVEAPTGTTVGELLDSVGGPSHHLSAILLGGYHGAWVAWPQARELPLANRVLRPHGLAVGAGVVVALPADVCGVAESMRVLNYLAAESAGQCGPCVFGLPRLAATFGELARGKSGGRRDRRLEELSTALERRGGCSHPDGSLRFLRSASAVFARELHVHAQRRCSAVAPAEVLPVPGFRG